MVTPLDHSNNSYQPIKLKKVNPAGRLVPLVSLLIFVLLTSVVAGVGLWSAGQQLTQNVNQRLTSSLTYLSSWLDDQNTSNKIAAEGLASQRNVVAALLQHERGKPELDRLLAVGLLRKLNVSFIAFVDSDRKIIASDPTDLPKEWLPKTTIEAALAGQPLPAGAELGENKLLLTASSSVQNENQTVGAVILGDLLDDTVTTAVDLKRATGLDVAIVLKGKLQTTSLPLSANKATSTLQTSPDLNEIETALKGRDQLIGDIRLNNHSYKAGYKAILSNRYLIGEVMLVLPQSEIDQTWWGQVIPLLVILPITWLVGGLMLFYLFNYHELSSNNLAASGFSLAYSIQQGEKEASKAAALPLLTSPEPRLELASDILSTTTGATLSQTENRGAEADSRQTNQAQNLEELAALPLVSPAPSRQNEEEASKETAAWEYFGKLTLNRAAYEAKLEGQLLSMTRTEFELLCVLASRPNKVISRNELITLVWGEDYLGEPGTVDAHISNLRRKVEADPIKPAMIITVRGVGYKFQPPV